MSLYTIVGVLRIARSTKNWSTNAVYHHFTTSKSTVPEMDYNEFIMWLNCVASYLEGKTDKAKMKMLLKLMENLV